MPSTSDIKDFIYRWNMSFPIDRWWRQKHKIPIFSKEHRDSCFIDQLIEFHEDRIFAELTNRDVIKPYEAGTGNWINIQKLSKQDIDDAFDRIKI